MPSRAKSVLATLGIAAAAMALPLVFRKRGSSRREDDDFYDKQVTPSWAPPGWAFPVAWGLNTVALAAAHQYVGFRQNMPRRTELLTYLYLHWLLYGTFSRVYFDERSPMLAAGWTAADFAVCHLAFYRALGVDGKVAGAFVPVNLWLTLALPLSLYQAAANRDPIFGTLGIEVGEIVAGALGVTPVPTSAIA